MKTAVAIVDLHKKPFRTRGVLDRLVRQTDYEVVRVPLHEDVRVSVALPLARVTSMIRDAVFDRTYR